MPHNSNDAKPSEKEAKRKRVRFADETPETRPEAVKNSEEAPQDPSETSFQMLEENAAQDLTEDANSTMPPSATDIDPAEVQEERRRRLAASQDEELRWAHLKAVLSGEESKLSYRCPNRLEDCRQICVE
ncbi:unnamed protein product [Phytophthora lilii]|uniref:Unnamed protein product n=1 Tax=Phytophthora lilii TaxID=2077276 RepID=A0A9W6TD11_9STRA|nr:unnamed protein product [Phytophthora lilii]